MKNILFAICFVSTLSPAMAQNAVSDVQKSAARTEAPTNKQMNSKQGAKHNADKLHKKLNLNTDQHAKILAVNMEVMKRKEALKAQNGKPDKAALKEISAYRREQFAAILTPDQMEQWKVLRAEEKQKHKNRMGMKNNRLQNPAADMPAKAPAVGATFQK